MFELPKFPKDDKLQADFKALVDKVRQAYKFCDGLIDQNRYIGNDPMGYKCSEVATEIVWHHGLYWNVCGKCKHLHGTKDSRLTLPIYALKRGTDE